MLAMYDSLEERDKYARRLALYAIDTDHDLGI